MAQLKRRKNSFWQEFYKHLMTGISYMIPVLIMGGLIGAFSQVIPYVIFKIEPNVSILDAIKTGQYTGMNLQLLKLASLMESFGFTLFGFAIPMFAAFVANSIGGKTALAAGFIGGYVANKPISVVGMVDGAWDKITPVPSGFLGALVAGFLAGGIIFALRYAFSWIPRSLEGVKPIFLFPVLGSFIMGVLMLFVVNAPMASIMTAFRNFIESLSGSGKIVLGFVVGSMMAIDMGGPINKASYVTATALVTSSGAEGSDVMAATMLGGMIPPLAIALSATISKNLWPKTQRGSALVNYVMGFSFITEGAIPFAASNPLRVIPPLFFSSGVAGALSMLFSCKSKAPHGGMFAVLVGAVSNPLMYIIAMLIGTALGAALLIVSLNIGNKKAEK